MLHQVAEEKEAADLAAKQLIKDEERKQTKAAAKQAKTQRKRAQQKLAKHEDQTEDQQQHSVQNLESTSVADASAVQTELDAKLQGSVDTGIPHEPTARVELEAESAEEPIAPITPGQEPHVSRKGDSDIEFLNKLSCCPITRVLARCMLPT